MLREMCKSKIHRATITEVKVDYSGSITIDSDLMERADIIEYEKVLIANIENGQRFDTYAIPAEPGSGTIGLLGGAAKLGSVGDKVIIMSFFMLEDDEAKTHKRKLVLVDEKNMPVKDK